jgi:hypothetical protein
MRLLGPAAERHVCSVLTGRDTSRDAIPLSLVTTLRRSLRRRSEPTGPLIADRAARRRQQPSATASSMQAHCQAGSYHKEGREDSKKLVPFSATPAEIDDPSRGRKRKGQALGTALCRRGRQIACTTPIYGARLFSAVTSTLAAQTTSCTLTSPWLVHRGTLIPTGGPRTSRCAEG